MSRGEKSAKPLTCLTKSMTEFVEVESGNGSALPKGTVTIRQNKIIYLPAKTFEMLGEPNGLLLYSNGVQLGFETTTRDDRQRKNYYPVNNQPANSGIISCCAAIKDLAIENGIYEIEYNDSKEFWVLDFEGGNDG